MKFETLAAVVSVLATIGAFLMMIFKGGRMSAQYVTRSELATLCQSNEERTRDELKKLRVELDGKHSENIDRLDKLNDRFDSRNDKVTEMFLKLMERTGAGR